MSSKSILVSICVQTYNHADYISDCLNGILKQKVNFDYEIILGEDDSTDNTRIICQEYAEKYPDKIRLSLRRREDVIYINGKPTGRYNFIENLKQCKGKYIALCEGDDYWTDELKLQSQIDVLESNSKASGSFHDTLFLIQGSEEKKRNWRNYTKINFSFKDTIATKALFHTSSFVFRRNCLNFPDWFTKIQSGDMALFSIIASKGDLIRVPKTMSVYRKNETGITNFINLKEYHKARILLQKYLAIEFPNLAKSKKLEVVSFHKKELKKLKWQEFKTVVKRIIKPNG